MAYLPDMERDERQNALEMNNTEQTLNILKDHLKRGQGISLVRYGDGEAMMLEGIPGNIERIIKRQFGMVSYEDGLKIREVLMQALAGCDILGIPVRKKIHEPDNYWFKAQSILMRFVPVLDKQFTNIDFHYHIQDRYNELFALAPRIFYISCRDLDARLHEITGKDVKSYRIAPEMMFTSYEGAAHYPDQFVKIEGWMDRQNIKGALCLVGAGVLGKIYCNWFRDRGGIAVDIGSMFDQWAGYVTRGKERGKDVRTNENIL